MTERICFPFPRKVYTQWCESFYTQINGPEAVTTERMWNEEKWEAHVICSRGNMLEKAGVCRIHLAEGTIYEAPGSLEVFETLAYPANPLTPGLIVMSNMSDTESMGRAIVFYTDLIVQSGASAYQAKKFFGDSVMSVCHKHGYDYNEYAAFMTGRGLLGGCAAECGIMGFFEEKDISFIENLIQQAIDAYTEILHEGRDNSPQASDYDAMFASRARLVEWLAVEDYGVKVARENGIPLAVMESYGFPPVVKY